jgi:hypothetical protein
VTGGEHWGEEKEKIDILLVKSVWSYRGKVGGTSPNGHIINKISKGVCRHTSAAKAAGQR